MNSNKDCVILDIKTFNRFKNSEIKANLVIDQLFDLIIPGDNNEDAKFNQDTLLTLRDLLKLTYPERYKNKVAEFNN